MNMPPNNSKRELTPLNESFRIQLKMESDWHIGSGTGRPGEVNRLVRRDDHGLPFIPAKTLNGIWRDACERVAYGLDDGKPGAWSAWVPFLFGQQPGHPGEELIEKSPDDYLHPRPAALSVRSAHLPLPLCQALVDESRTLVRDAITFLKPGVKIDSRSGRAREKHLRFDEMGRIGAVLEADCAIVWENCKDEEKRVATALLLAGARFVERIGGKRRRGAGRCSLGIIDYQDLQPALLLIDSLQNPSPPPDFNQDAAALSFEAASGDWLRYSLEIITRSPVIISKRTVGNQVETADYLPGTYLLTIMRRKLKHTRVNLDAAIVHGDLIFTNATVETGGIQGRPVPFAICHEKLNGGFKQEAGVYNRLCDELDFQEKTPQVKDYRSGYVGATAAGTIPAYRTIKREITTHNVVLDAKQRPDEDVVGVYSYQAIKTGQRFRAELRIKSSLVGLLEKGDRNWLESLQGRHRIGRSKKDEYGVIDLTNAESIADDLVLPQLDNVKPPETLTVWLLSDLLLRDERLRPSASIAHLQKAIVEKTGLKLKPHDSGKQNLLSTSTRQNRTESWHVSWNRPRPTLTGLAAGSCIVFEVAEGAIDEKAQATLARVEIEGLGERRAEGYGQIRFNDPMLTSRLGGVAGSVRPNASITTEKRSFLLSMSGTFDFGRMIEREAVRREIERRVLAFADTLDKRTEALGIKIDNKKAESLPPLSQLGALRSIVARLRSDNDSDKQRFNSWFGQLEMTDNRAEKWPGGKKENGSFQKIYSLINVPSRVWSLLDLGWQDLIITETGRRDLEKELWAEAVRALVDACVRKQKRDIEKLQQARQRG